MIDNDSDDSEEYKIFEDSCKHGNATDEVDVITDFSSPLKCDQDDKIDIVLSPEPIFKVSRKIKHQLMDDKPRKKKRKLDFIRENLKNKPCLNVTYKNALKVKQDSSDSCLGVPSLELSNPNVIPLNVKNAVSTSFKELIQCNTNESESSSTSNIEVNIIEVNDQSFHIDDAASQEIIKFGLETIDSSSDISVSEIKDTDNSDERSSFKFSANEQNISFDDCSSITSLRIAKKGSLLEKSYNIIKFSRKESSLFSHEINAGLRSSSGIYVTDALLVQSVSNDEAYHIISCIPKIHFSDCGLAKKLKSSYIHIIVSEINNDISTNDIVVVHFPVYAMIDISSKNTFIFTENRLQVIEKNSVQYCPNDNRGNVSIEFPKQSTPEQLFRTVKNRTGKNILDAAVGRLLYSYSILELEVLQIFKKRLKHESSMKLLTIDSENQFCILHLYFSEEMTYMNPEVNSLYTFIGFNVTEFYKLTSEMKCVAEYYASLPTTNDYFFEMKSAIKNWKMCFLRKSRTLQRDIVPLSSLILLNDTKRIKLAVNFLSMVGNKVFIRDSSVNDSVELKMDDSNIDIEEYFPSIPFQIDGILLKNGSFYFDEFSVVQVLSSVKK